ncbi:MAG: hypothetical protein HQ485_01145 [Acidobacteria bacterium]|nr:hypothetical protein [Acidobacteriota bacterium]
MKICLATLHADENFLPLALLYLKANLVERHGYPFDDVVIEELSPKATVDEHVAQILAGAPDAVGRSCYIWNSLALRTLARQQKAIRPLTSSSTGRAKSPSPRLLRHGGLEATSTRSQEFLFVGVRRW